MTRGEVDETEMKQEPDQSRDTWQNLASVHTIDVQHPSYKEHLK